jgi:hypothetical protein
MQQAKTHDKKLYVQPTFEKRDRLVEITEGIGQGGAVTP